MAPGFFQPEAYLTIPNLDLLSWMFDEPLYDLNKTIFISANDTSRTLTALQCRDTIQQIAAGLIAAGLKPGDTLLLHSFNDINYPLLVLGTIAAGGIWTGTNPSHTPAELTHHIRASSTTFIISEPEILPSILTAGRACNIPAENYWIFDNLPSQSVPVGFRSWRTLLEHGKVEWKRFNDYETAASTTCFRLFSSGTTGLPKAANLSHHNLIAQHHVMHHYRERTYEPSYCFPLPMFHAACVPAAHTAMLRGGWRAAIMRRWDLPVYLRTLELFQITDQTVVPPIVLALVNADVQGKEACFASIRNTACGAAPLSKELQARLHKLLPRDSTMSQVWGMTETTCVATRLWAGEHDESGSVGYLVPGLEAKLIGDDGKEIREYGVPGEMWVRGKTVFQGYHVNEEANRASFDKDGFYRTGDVMYCDEKTKRWFIIDRKKELIKVRGFQVVPPELEGVLLQHPDIVDAAVIGVKDTAAGELPRAYVVRRQGSRITEKDVYEWTASRLAGYKRLDGGVEFVVAVPKNASGKILKRELREAAERERRGRL